MAGDNGQPFVRNLLTDAQRVNQGDRREPGEIGYCDGCRLQSSLFHRPDEVKWCRTTSDGPSPKYPLRGSLKNLYAAHLRSHRFAEGKHRGDVELFGSRVGTEIERCEYLVNLRLGDLGLF